MDMVTRGVALKKKVGDEVGNARHSTIWNVNLRGLGGVVVIDAAIGAHGRVSRPVHYLTVAATLDKSLTSHWL